MPKLLSGSFCVWDTVQHFFLFILWIPVLLLLALMQSSFAHSLPKQESCDQIRFSTLSAIPFTPIKVDGIPDSVADSLIIDILIEDESAGRTPIFITEPGAGFFYAPINPAFSRDATQVNLQFVYELESCESYIFSIEELPAAPGFLESTADLYEDILRVKNQAVAELSPSLALKAATEADPLERPAIFASRLIYGTENYPPLREMLSYDHYADMLDAREWEMIEAIYARWAEVNAQADTGLGQPGDFLRRSTGSLRLETTSPEFWASSASFSPTDPAKTYKTSFLTTKESFVILPNECSPREFYNPSAAQLQEYLQARREALAKYDLADQIGDYVTQAQGVMITFGAVAGPKGYAAIRGSAVMVNNAVGLTITAAGLAAEFSASALPSILGDLRIEHEGPFTFLEDDDSHIFEWDSASIMAYSNSFDYLTAVAKLGMSLAGGNVIERLYKRSGPNHDLLSDLGADATELAIGMVLNEYESELFNLPECAFGPVDITEEPWSKSNPGLGNIGFIERVDHKTFEAIRDGEGVAIVCVTNELVDPGNDGCLMIFDFEHLPIHVSPITVRMLTPGGAVARNMEVEPGKQIEFYAQVVNANNENVLWSVDNPAHTILVHDTEGHHITLQTSDKIDHFPVVLSVESLAETGLRAHPDAPVRNHRINIRGYEPDEIFSCLNEFEIAMREVDRCGFVAYVEGVIPQSGDLPSASLNECMTGEIFIWNVNSHGIHHIEMRGRSDEAGARFRLRFDYDGEGRVELSGSNAAMYGTAFKRVEYPGRTPTGGSAGMRVGENSSDALESRSVEVVAYPLAGMPYYGVRFSGELTPISRARRHRGLTYNVEGILLGSEQCP